MAWHPELPVIGKLHLSTVLLFDLGVYLLVIGAAALILVALAHQSLRRRQRLPAAARLAGMTIQPFSNLPAPATPKEE